MWVFKVLPVRARLAWAKPPGPQRPLWQRHGLYSGGCSCPLSVIITIWRIIYSHLCLTLLHIFLDKSRIEWFILFPVPRKMCPSVRGRTYGSPPGGAWVLVTILRSKGEWGGGCVMVPCSYCELPSPQFGTVYSQTEKVLNRFTSHWAPLSTFL